MVLAQMQSQNQLQSRSESHVVTNSPLPHWDWDYVPHDICHLSGHMTMAICVSPCTHLDSSMSPTYRSFGTKLLELNCDFPFSFHYWSAYGQLPVFLEWEIIQNQHTKIIVLPFFILFSIWAGPGKCYTQQNL